MKKKQNEINGNLKHSGLVLQMIDSQPYFFYSFFFLKNNNYSKQEIYNNLLGHLEDGLLKYKIAKLLVYINEPVEQ